MGSSRFPGKVLKSLDENTTILDLLLKRISNSKLINKIVITTSNLPHDDIIAEKVNLMGYWVYRGPENDLLRRFEIVVQSINPSLIVRLLGDCPLIDSSIIDNAIGLIKKNKTIEFISNQNPHTFPDGMDVSVFTLKAFEKLIRMKNNNYIKEHIVPGFWERSDEFQLMNFESEVNLFNRYRITLDYQEDFLLIQKLFIHFGFNIYDCKLNEIIKFLRENKNIANLNSKYIISES